MRLRALLGAVLAAVPVAVLAHGGEDMNMGAAAAAAADHQLPEPSPSQGPHSPDTYFFYPEYRPALYAHISVMVLAWVFILPVAVMFSIARSRYTTASRLVFTIANAVGLVFGMIYNENTPDLYPNNAHHKLGWIVTAVFCAQLVIDVLGRRAGIFQRKSASVPALRGASHFTPISTEAMAEYHRASRASTDNRRRFSYDSGQGTEPNTASLCSHEHDEEAAIHKEDAMLLQHDSETESYDDRDHHHALSKHPSRAVSPMMRVGHFLSTKASGILVLTHDVIDRVILILGFIAICTGVIAQGRLFEDHEIFSGLAHWIKGGVFFWLGVLTLGRWTGAFGDMGWAWNARPRGAPWRPSGEMFESALIFIYGSTNIFLEHLGSDASGTWTAQDLEHVSITVLFIGGGLCGMLVESAWVRDLLNAAVPTTSAAEAGDGDDDDDDDQDPPAPSVPLNPIPALVILLLGIMMSSHTQHSMVSSMVHKQWGTLLSGSAFARAFTYVLMYLKPPRSMLPSRPPTELLAAFGLMAGGVIFMASSSDTVQGMINQNLDAMFMYTVTMGLVAFLMAWIVIVLAIKGWAVRKEAHLQAHEASGIRR